MPRQFTHQLAGRCAQLVPRGVKTWGNVFGDHFLPVFDLLFVKIYSNLYIFWSWDIESRISDIGYLSMWIHPISDIFKFADIRYPIFPKLQFLTDTISDIWKIADIYRYPIYRKTDMPSLVFGLILYEGYYLKVSLTKLALVIFIHFYTKHDIQNMLVRVVCLNF